jgi:hypothetical protein
LNMGHTLHAEFVLVLYAYTGVRRGTSRDDYLPIAVLVFRDPLDRLYGTLLNRFQVPVAQQDRAAAS